VGGRSDVFWFCVGLRSMSFVMFLGVCGSVGGVVLVHSRLLYVFDREDDVCLIRGHDGGWRGVGWCIVCEGVHCFQRRGLCVVGSRGIVSFVLLLLLLFVVCFPVVLVMDFIV